MSYCRWSSDDYQCDVYVYESQAGVFTTHVAVRRYVFATPLPAEEPFDGKHIQAFVKRAALVGRMVDSATQVPIGLAEDGETFEDASAAECAERLEYLRGLGYRVPQYAIDMLRAEAEAPM